MKVTTSDLRRLVERMWKSGVQSPDSSGFTLASGRAVLLRNFHMGETYGGFEGMPSAVVNDDRVARSMNRMTKIWGPRATYLVDPVSRIGAEWGPARREVRIPPYCYHAWLTSNAMDKEHCASELVVIWFGELEVEMTLRGMVERACHDVPWEKYAQDFDY